MTTKSANRLPLPAHFDDLGFPLTVVRRKLKGKLGQYDTEAHEIALGVGDCDFGERIILIHEALHVVEMALIESGQLSGYIDHDFISASAFGVAVILFRAGAFPDLTEEDFEVFKQRAEEIEIEALGSVEEVKR